MTKYKRKKQAPKSATKNEISNAQRLIEGEQEIRQPTKPSQTYLVTRLPLNFDDGVISIIDAVSPEQALMRARIRFNHDFFLTQVEIKASVAYAKRKDG